MISFLEFKNQHQKKFVCLKFTEETNRKLLRYAINNGFDLTVSYNGDVQDPSEFEFHTTIYYTNTKHNTQNQRVALPPFTLKVSRFELLGKDHDVPVLKITPNEELKQIRDIFTAQGFADSWPDYKPHISLSYKREKYNFTGMKLPDFPIIADHFVIKDS